MTREKAIDILNSLKNYYNNKDQCGYVGFDDEDNKALGMAIKALKKEPCEDWHDVPSDEMTLEQAREFLQDRIRFIDENYPEAINYKKALKTAVRELGKQRCEDCISRQYVKEQMIKYGFHAPDMTVTEFVEDMPSVTPQPKVGQWIEGKYRDDDIRYNDSSYKCNKCGRIVDFKENYCPDCGCVMKGELE